MKLDMELDVLKDLENVEMFLDTLKISKFSSKNEKYSLFIRLGFLVKKFEYKIWRLKDEVKDLKETNKELRKTIKLLKKGI